MAPALDDEAAPVVCWPVRKVLISTYASKESGVGVRRGVEGLTIMHVRQRHARTSLLLFGRKGEIERQCMRRIAGRLQMSQD